jgi:hypothetical protein
MSLARPGDRSAGAFVLAAPLASCASVQDVPPDDAALARKQQPPEGSWR